MFKATSREICSILSPGTRTYCHFDTMNHNDAAGEANLHSFLKEMNYVYPTTTTLIAIKEIIFPKNTSQSSEDGDNSSVGVSLDVFLETVFNVLLIATFEFCVYSVCLLSKLSYIFVFLGCVCVLIASSM